MAEAGTEPVSCIGRLEEEGVIVVVTPFNLNTIFELAVKPCPSTIRVKKSEPACAETGVNSEMLNVGVKLFRTTDHAPRPWVAAIITREGSCSRREKTATLGRLELLNVEIGRASCRERV